MRPIIRAENSKVAVTRERMLKLSSAIDNGDEISQADQEWLFKVAEKYQIAIKAIDDEQAWEQLKRRVDTVPYRLALAQAANESSWGTSRFAREGRNFFGEWCFTQGCGIVPKRRGQEDTHEVEIFETVNDSVASYIRNLNRVGMYLPLRTTRLEMRQDGNKPTAYELATGLKSYSARGHDYVKEIQQMILTNYDLMAVPSIPAQEKNKLLTYSKSRIGSTNPDTLAAGY